MRHLQKTDTEMLQLEDVLYESLAQPNKCKILIYSCPHMVAGIDLITQSDLSKVSDQHN